MRSSEIRFKSQGVQNCLLTRIKVSNLINSTARDVQRIDVFLSHVKEAKKKGKQVRMDGSVIKLVKPWLSATLMLSALLFLKRGPFALKHFWVLCEHTWLVASAAIIEPELVITHFTISHVTSKQQQSCHQRTHHAAVVQSRASGIFEATHCCFKSH